jgi:hypothetical protein
MYCWNCGRQNPDENAYCGACGRKLVRSQDAVDTTPPPVVNREPSVERQPVAPVQANPLIEEPRVVRERVVPEPAAPVYSQTVAPNVAERRVPRASAPSMYGLNEGDEGIGDSDYLLEEEEPRSAWRGVLAVILLALIGLLIYKQWNVISASTRELGNRVGVSKNESPQPANQASAPATTAHDGNVSSADITVNNDETPATPPPADTPLSNEDPNKSAAPAPGTPATTEEEQLDRARSTPATPPPNIAQDNSQVDTAQKYLQGRGVAQDCARGVSLLRSAAGKGNAKAQIQLGALYATGHCVTQDKAMAYRWFAQAQDLEPGNNYVSRNLNSLWANMTQEERQRAETR